MTALRPAFDRAMAAFAPFEPEPRLALAVSGGADSMALAWLAHDWAARRGGRVTALTVDHRLRAASRREALEVKGWLTAEGIEHRILTWGEGAGGSRANLQARAREARYGLLRRWCGEHGVLHLLTAHHRLDQAETVTLRMARGSTAYGLAGMSAVREFPETRLLRPLLHVPKGALRAWLARHGRRWIEDPSNADPAFDRVRVRRAMDGAADAGALARRLLARAAAHGAERVQSERAIAALLGRAARPDPAGFVVLDRSVLLEAPRDHGMRALARVLGAVAGAGYAPRRARLGRLYDELRDAPRARTLGGCRVLPRAGERLLVCREAAAQAPPVAVAGSGTVHWDGRFAVRVGGRVEPGLIVGALGLDGWEEVGRHRPEIAESPAAQRIPACVRATLPALKGRRGVISVPHLGYRRAGGDIATVRLVQALPFVSEPMAGAGFVPMPAGGAPDGAGNGANGPEMGRTAWTGP